MDIKIRNNFDAVVYAVERRTQAVLNELARDGKEAVQQDWESGVYGIQEDTGSSSASFYTVEPQQGGVKSGYNEAVQSFAQLYYQRYTLRHLEERIAAPLETSSSRDVKRAGFASASQIVSFWEYGHRNKWTGSFEHAPIVQTYMEGMKDNMMLAFIGMMKRSYHQGS